MKFTKSVFALWLLIAATGAMAFDNQPEGFRGLKWGTPFDSVRAEMTPTDQSGVKCYKRKDDLMSIGGADVHSIIYCFEGGGLTSVTVDTVGDDNNILFSAVLIGQFGMPEPDTHVIFKKAEWDGSVTYINHKYNEATAIGSAVFLSKKHWLEKQKQKVKVNNEPRGGF